MFGGQNMMKIFLTIIIGVIAGIIDIMPMIFQKLDRFSIISAFVQWVVAAFVIIYIQLGISSWSKGFIVAELMALPIVILVMKTDIKSVAPILVMSAILGSAIGFISDKIAG